MTGFIGGFSFDDRFVQSRHGSAVAECVLNTGAPKLRSGTQVTRAVGLPTPCCQLKRSGVKAFAYNSSGSWSAGKKIKGTNRSKSSSARRRRIEKKEVVSINYPAIQAWSGWWSLQMTTHDAVGKGLLRVVKVAT